MLVDVMLSRSRIQPGRRRLGANSNSSIDSPSSRSHFHLPTNITIVGYLYFIGNLTVHRFLFQRASICRRAPVRKTMAAADVRDMLDLPAEGQPRPHKKQKVVEKRPGVSCMIAKKKKC